MKSNILFPAVALSLAVTFSSCGGSTSQKAQEKKIEEKAVVEGQIPKSVLTQELKQETTLLLKDMPSSDLPYKVMNGEVEISVAKLDYMLPLSVAGDLVTSAQRAIALGIYFTDKDILLAMKKPSSEIDALMVKLATDLNIAFIVDVLKKPLPVNATKEQLGEFLQQREDEIIDLMMTNDQCHTLINILCGMTAEYAYVYSNPGLVVKGDATGAGLTDNLTQRVKMLGEIASDLSTYYPEMKRSGDIIAPLEEMTISVTTARANNAKIAEIRSKLLK